VDRANQVAALWVKTTVKGNCATQSFLHVLGQPVAPGAGDSKAVFSQAEGWVAAWHLGDDAATTPDASRTPPA
jgi:hypothetical protein